MVTPKDRPNISHWGNVCLHFCSRVSSATSPSRTRPPPSSLATMINWAHQSGEEEGRLRYLTPDTVNLIVCLSYPVGCCYDAVQFKVILHTILQWLEQNLNLSLYLQKAPCISASLASYGASCDSFAHILQGYFSGTAWGNFMLVPVPVKWAWRIWVQLAGTKP